MEDTMFSNTSSSMHVSYVSVRWKNKYILIPELLATKYLSMAL